jgi:hypothetical protein
MKSELAEVATVSQPFRISAVLPALGVASLLAAGTNAYGAVIFTPLNGTSGTTIPLDSVLPIDLNGGGTDIALMHTTGEGGYLIFQGAFLSGNPTSPIVSNGNVALIGANQTLGSGNSFGTPGYTTIWGAASLGDWGGMSGTIRGYVGCQVMVSVTPYYGWLDLGIDRSNGGSTTLFGYAYESTGGASITTPAAIPEPSAAALVAGAAALLALRQRRRKDAA